MRSLIERLKGLTELLLLAVVLVGWSGVSEGGGFTGPDSTVSVSITADKTTLPINILNTRPSIGSPYTNTVTVTVKQNGELFEAPINVAIASGLSSGALYYLDGDPTHEKCPVTGETVDNCSVATVPIAYRSISLPVGDNGPTSIYTFHFSASSVPGTVVLTASAKDPISGKVISGSLTIQVVGGGGGVTGGDFPSVVQFVMDPAPLYIRNNPLGTTLVTQNTVKLFQIFVKNDLGQSVTTAPGTHTLQVQLLPNRPNGGEWLSTTDANGNAQEGTSVLADIVGGAATLALHSGTLPGTAVISATADRRDNNVDNGIQMGITNYASVSIGTGEIASITFTGPLADAVDGKWNALAAQIIDPTTLQPCPDLGPPPDVQCWKNALWAGTYYRYIQVITADAYGNPPPAGTPITFRLIDGPLDMLNNRYPEQGHGQFAITGYNGNPAEGGYEFFAPNRTVPRVPGDTLNPFVVPNGVSFAAANPNCTLMLQDPEIINPNPDTINALPAEGRLEYHVGSRIITGRQGNMLTVNTPFNQTSQNVGANVWYTVGCPPHHGNVMNFNYINSPVFGQGEVNVMTDINGVAATVMNYPGSQVGRRFMLAAEANGGKAGAVMTHWYLGIPDQSLLGIVGPPALAATAKTAAGDPFVMPPSQESCSMTTGVGVVRITATFTVTPGAAVDQSALLQLVDSMANGDCDLDNIPEGSLHKPIAGQPIAVEIVINNPAEAAAVAAEDAVTVAKAALTAFDLANPGVCDLVVTADPAAAPAPRDPAKCTQRTALVATLDAATTAAVQARTRAGLHTPTAAVVPAVLATDGGGYVNATLQVNDLPTDGSVTFTFSTVGVNAGGSQGVISNSIVITASPPPPPNP